MNINRHNYEESFILYLDNELGSDDRRRVEEFVEQNPDLKEELEILLQSKFTPDTSLVFNGKDELMKNSASSFITLSNYEEWLVLYMDRELAPGRAREVEQFIALHPHLQKELELFQQTRVQPEETIVFPGKESLYRRTEKVRVISINWRRIAVAAVLLLSMGIATVAILNKKHSPEKGIARAPGKIQKTNAENPVVSNNKESDKQQEAPVIARKSSPVVTPVKQPGNETLVKRGDNNSRNQKQPANLPVPEKNKDQEMATTVGNDKKSNNLPQPLNNPNINNKASFDNTGNNSATDLAIISSPSDHLKSSIQNINTSNAVTKGAAQPSDFIRTAASMDTKDVADLDESTSKKGKLRGFLRKVTRTFEKKTNINATDDDERLLVGGLAIKLK